MRRSTTGTITPAVIAVALLLGACSAAPTAGRSTDASPVSSAGPATSSLSEATTPVGPPPAG